MKVFIRLAGFITLFSAVFTSCAKAVPTKPTTYDLESMSGIYLSKETGNGFAALEIKNDGRYRFAVGATDQVAVDNLAGLTFYQTANIDNSIITGDNIALTFKATISNNQSFTIYSWQNTSVSYTYYRTSLTSTPPDNGGGTPPDPIYNPETDPNTDAYNRDVIAKLTNPTNGYRVQEADLYEGDAIWVGYSRYSKLSTKWLAMKFIKSGNKIDFQRGVGNTPQEAIIDLKKPAEAGPSPVYVTIPSPNDGNLYTYGKNTSHYKDIMNNAQHPEYTKYEYLVSRANVVGNGMGIYYYPSAIYEKGKMHAYDCGSPMTETKPYDQTILYKDYKNVFPSYFN